EIRRSPCSPLAPDLIGDGFLPGGVLARRDAGPASKGAREAADVGEAEREVRWPAGQPCRRSLTETRRPYSSALRCAAPPPGRPRSRPGCIRIRPVPLHHLVRVGHLARRATD